LNTRNEVMRMKDGGRRTTLVSGGRWSIIMKAIGAYSESTNKSVTARLMRREREAEKA
jgi:hypothetical protein